MSDESGGSGGCLWFLLLIILVWFLACGLNYDGKHYELSCDDNGVTIHE